MKINLISIICVRIRSVFIPVYRHSQYRFWFSWLCVYPSGACYLPQCMHTPAVFAYIYIYKTNYSVQIEEPVKTQKGGQSLRGQSSTDQKTQSESQFLMNRTTSSSAELYPSVTVHGGTIQPTRFSLAIYIQQVIVH